MDRIGRKHGARGRFVAQGSRCAAEEKTPAGIWSPAMSSDTPAPYAPLDHSTGPKVAARPGELHSAEVSERPDPTAIRLVFEEKAVGSDLSLADQANVSRDDFVATRNRVGKLTITRTPRDDGINRATRCLDRIAPGKG